MNEWFVNIINERELKAIYNIRSLYIVIKVISQHKLKRKSYIDDIKF
jgi:hypothetical protein